jgi:hypothetical protein
VVLDVLKLPGGCRIFGLLCSFRVYFLCRGLLLVAILKVCYCLGWAGGCRMKPVEHFSVVVDPCAGVVRGWPE